MCKCNLCGRDLTSPLSVERGYGPTCFRIHTNMQKTQKNELDLEVLEYIKTENSFLKMEIKMIKRQLKTIRLNPGTVIEPIERIKQDEHRPERDANKPQMAYVMKELKTIFQSMDNIRSLLETPTEFSQLNPPIKNIYS